MCNTSTNAFGKDIQVRAGRRAASLLINYKPGQILFARSGHYVPESGLSAGVEYEVVSAPAGSALVEVKRRDGKDFPDGAGSVQRFFKVRFELAWDAILKAPPIPVPPNLVLQVAQLSANPRLIDTLRDEVRKAGKANARKRKQLRLQEMQLRNLKAEVRALRKERMLALSYGSSDLKRKLQQAIDSSNSIRKIEQAESILARFRARYDLGDLDAGVYKGSFSHLEHHVQEYLPPASEMKNGIFEPAVRAVSSTGRISKPEPEVQNVRPASFKATFSAPYGKLNPQSIPRAQHDFLFETPSVVLGHEDNGSALQKHSIGEVYPYVIYGQQDDPTSEVVYRILDGRTGHTHWSSYATSQKAQDIARTWADMDKNRALRGYAPIKVASHGNFSTGV